MTIQYCDVCGKKVLDLNTIVLYKQPIDYCENCRKKVMVIVSEYERVVEIERHSMYDLLKKKEKYYIKLLKGNKK